jgi:cysteine-rich repeat protein
MKLWVIVDGAGATDVGAFGLSVQSRPIVCGDGHTDGTEACDDTNTVSGDGCSSTCTIELKEIEPNDTVAQANTWASPFTATIGSASDVDVVKVTVTKAGGTISASVVDFGDNACELSKIDSYLELLGTDGNTVLSADDNSGDGLCSSLSKTGLAVGTYYLIVSAAPGANPASFAYKLNVTLS